MSCEIVRRPVEPHDLEADVRLGEALAEHRIARDVRAAGRRHQRLVLGWRSAAAGRGRPCPARSRAWPSRPSSHRRPRRPPGRPDVRASSKNTSLNSAVPVSCRIGRSSTPGWSIGHRRKLRPRCFPPASGSVRHTTKIQSAMWPRLVHTFCPVIRHWSPSRDCGRLDVGEVGAGVGLGEALAPELLGPEDRSEEALSLGVVPNAIRVGPSSCSPKNPHRAGPSARAYSSLKISSCGERRVAAAMLLRPRQPDPAALGQLPLPALANGELVGPAQVVAGAQGRRTRR